MSRVKRSGSKRRRHKKILRAAKGYRGAKHRTFRAARENLLHALAYAYRDRRTKKRERRSLWILKINAAARAHGMRYSELLHALNQKGFALNRKTLAYLAEHEPERFAELVAQVKS